MHGEWLTEEKKRQNDAEGLPARGYRRCRQGATCLDEGQYDLYAEVSRRTKQESVTIRGSRVLKKIELISKSHISNK